MTADLLVVHLVSRGVTGVRSGWDTPNGTVRHEVVSWSRSPATLSKADIVVAHGLAPLVVAQAVAGAGPLLVYRPVTASRISQRRLRNGLHADWVAAPNRRIGRATAGALGLDRNHVTVFRNDDRATWDALTATLLAHSETGSSVGTGTALQIRTAIRARGGWSQVPNWARARVSPATRPPGPPDVGEPPRTEWGDDTIVESFPDAAITTDVAPDIAPDIAPIISVVPAATTGATTAGLPPLLAAGVADPTTPGQPWWKYRPLEARQGTSNGRGPHVHSADVPSGYGHSTNGHSTNGHSTNGHGANGHGANGHGPNGAAAPPVQGPPPLAPPPAKPGPAGEPRGPVQIVAGAARSGVGFFALGIVTLLIVAVASQLGTIGEGPFLIPIAGLFFALAAARRIARRRPEEAWVGNWLVLGLIAKLFASYFRYFTLIHTYNGLGDAADYDKVGREYANSWLNGGPGPVLYSSGLRKTNFVRWFTGVTYYAFGSKLLTGTFVFALLALVGSYFWYRATADSVPFVNRKLYLGFVLFAPSIVFWPSIVGKEALMQFGLGVVVLGASFLLRQKLLTGFPITFAGGWLVWVVRPHLLALVAIATGAAYLAGRVRKQEGKKAGFLTRPLGIIIIAFLVAFTIGQGAQFLGLKSLSLTSVQSELNATTQSTSQGGSAFKHGTNSLSPLAWPMDAVTVFLRPFPWEVESSLQILASLESAALAVLIVVRFKSLRAALARSRESPFLMLCWVLTGLYAVSFASFANFGLLVRERSLVLPALLVLLAVHPPDAHEPVTSDIRSVREARRPPEISRSA
jgi:hypothetical protein